MELLAMAFVRLVKVALSTYMVALEVVSMTVLLGALITSVYP